MLKAEVRSEVRTESRSCHNETSQQTSQEMRGWRIMGSIEVVHESCGKLLINVNVFQESAQELAQESARVSKAVTKESAPNRLNNQPPICQLIGQVNTLVNGRIVSPQLRARARDSRHAKSQRDNRAIIKPSSSLLWEGGISDISR